jgi:butyryl-CoA dehydrogenase
MGVVYDDKYGGAEYGLCIHCNCCRRNFKVCASSGVIVSAHNSLCFSPINYFGTEEQKEKYLRSSAVESISGLSSDRT